jgi:hypothetical protein
MALRSTMSSLILHVRELAAIGTDDRTLEGTSTTHSYWSDEQVQTVLDRNRLDIVDEELSKHRSINSGGTAEYRIYDSQHRNYEATDGGTAIYYLRTSTGSRAGTATYTPDYASGRVLFAADTLGTAYFLNGRTYDVYAAAAEIWRQKAAQVAERFDFSADGASFRASQLMGHYERMAQEMEKKATFGEAAGVRTVTMFRDDVTTWG